MATILIVDTRPADRHLFVTLLGSFGHRMLEAGDGEQALELASAELPDLVITDIVMPHMDGFTLVRRLRGASACRCASYFPNCTLFGVRNTQTGDSKWD